MKVIVLRSIESTLILADKFTEDGLDYQVFISACGTYFIEVQPFEI